MFDLFGVYCYLLCCFLFVVVVCFALVCLLRLPFVMVFSGLCGLFVLFGFVALCLSCCFMVLCLRWLFLFVLF